MTVCLVNSILPKSTGGMHTFFRHFIQLFCAQKINIIFLSVDAYGAITEDAVKKHNKFYTEVSLSKSYHAQLAHFQPYFRPGGSAAPQWIAAGIALRNWLLQHHAAYKIDVTEVSDGSGIGIFLTGNLLPPLVVTNHGSNLQIAQYDYTAYDEHGNVIKELERLSYQNADALIAHSPDRASDLKVYTERPIFTVLIPFRPDTESKYVKANNTGLVTGRLRYIKGPTLLCEALQILKAQQPSAPVSWIGDDSATIKGYSSVAVYLQKKFTDVYDTSFLWQPSIPQKVLHNKMLEAGYIIIPSLWDTFNYTALEAASLGKPLIITRSTGASYLFTDNENALVVESNNVNGLAGAIKHLYKNEDLQKSLGSKARDMISEVFRPDRVVNERISVYDQVRQQRSKHTVTYEDNIAFLNKYTTKRRKWYFALRAQVKRFIKS